MRADELLYAIEVRDTAAKRSQARRQSRRAGLVTIGVAAVWSVEATVAWENNCGGRDDQFVIARGRRVLSAWLLCGPRWPLLLGGNNC
jgi:hypothetical protein